MGESAKATIALVMIVCLIGSAFALFDEPQNWHWAARIGFPFGAVLSVGILLWSMRRRDRAPDFLGQVAGRYFE